MKRKSARKKLVLAKVVIVTGASRGIGAATARLAAASGYDVCVVYKDRHESAVRVVAEIEALGRRALAVAADISRESEVERVFQYVDREFGALHALVNNVGVLERQQRVEEITAARLERVFSANVFASFLCAREAVRRMSTARGGTGGAIVNVSSIAARRGSAGEYVDYAASKGAIDTFTLGLAQEVAADGIRVNAVRPGFTHTEIHAAGGEPNRVARLEKTVPAGRGARPEEIAAAILWLLSEEASYCNGTFLDVSGGL